MRKVIKVNLLAPYFKIAETVARESPCARRQYAAMIAYEGTDFRYVVNNNNRQSSCCKGMCARTTLNLHNGERVEVGGEIHAETACLISAGPKSDDSHFILVGFQNGFELLGTDVFPCHTCSLNIRFAGYKHLYMKDANGFITPYSIEEVIKFREAAWEQAI